MRQILVLVAATLWLIPVANADNGVLEINQACAVHTGCFSGDDPGLPVTIDSSAGRSYRLTSDLTSSSSNPTDRFDAMLGLTAGYRLKF